jgi:hypothetical protein
MELESLSRATAALCPIVARSGVLILEFNRVRLLPARVRSRLPALVADRNRSHHRQRAFPVFQVSGIPDHKHLRYQAPAG